MECAHKGLKMLDFVDKLTKLKLFPRMRYCPVSPWSIVTVISVDCYSAKCYFRQPLPINQLQ